MSRILFVTFGTSAAENEEIAKQSPALKDRLGDDDVRTLVERLEDNPEQIDSLGGLLLAAHREFWERSDGYRQNPDNFRQTSAEMISTYTAILSGMLGTGSFLQRGRDKVVLLVSNTEIGRVCGALNATLFREYLYRIDKGDEDDVVVETVRGLNPKVDNPELFQVYPQIASILEHHIKGDTHQPLFNVTGGYKGLVPPITHIAWTRYTRLSTKILYMHDSMKATVTLSPEQGGFEMREDVTRTGRTRAHVDL